MYDVIVIGAGPAGLTAGLYTSRARLTTVILEKEVMGGELMNREMIENYPGYPEGIMGPELGSNMLNQAMNTGAQIDLVEVNRIDISRDYRIVQTSQGEYQGKGIIIASGAHPKKLGVPGEKELEYGGVFYCATCDGPAFTGKTVAVAGGGNSGVTEALFLARMANKVILIEAMPTLTATEILRERVRENPKIEVKCGARIAAIKGSGQVEGVDIIDVKNGQQSSMVVDGVLVHIGIEPNTQYLKDTVPLDKMGQVIVNDVMATEIPGIFAAGDIRSKSSWQVSTAVGDGATAAISLERYLADH
ncbi:NAD(P)/FAD-dependent oxidoreductase [Chloroflexota bacterium]